MTAATAPDETVIRESVALASRAPSLHNSQPWRWVAEADTLQLWADRARSMPATDHAGRELILSCGAVLDHLRVATSAAGWDSVTERMPDRGNPDHLATLRFHPMQAVTASQRHRADAIGQRRTDRLPFDPVAQWAAIEPVLRHAAVRYDVLLHVVADDGRAALAEASRLTENLRRNDTTYMSELRWWTSPFSSNVDHAPEGALLSTSEASRVDVARSFPPAGGGRRRSAIEHDQSKIVVLSTDSDDLCDVLRCGESLSAVLLECTMAGLATCTLTHMTEMAMSRNIIAEIVQTTSLPQLLIRIGKSPGHDQHVERSGRRPVDDVLEFRL
ncbi:putative NAD(P)H nitroreductase acg [Mycobacterium marinum]|uniref:Acg family FMN-binding oxidoreductase n=1 Tax=Mycobacterium marinum TaxID=1781 RepID=UPI000E3CEBE1|nr:NAD(P)H nitroreductase [Mycobacterium marinum]RFZ67587.1 putative NAD(P)H nitroreductase acg [Mycobacterium marinum]GJO46101.1 hypothetical protein NJB1604_25730 [Mycobacterium marinum]